MTQQTLGTQDLLEVTFGKISAMFSDCYAGISSVVAGALNGTLGATTPAAATVTTLTVQTSETTAALHLDTGTKTATASSGAATLNKMAGVITSESLTTAALASYTLTLTDSDIAATDQVFVSVANGTNSAGTPAISTVAPGTGAVVIVIANAHATAAFNGTLKISFAVLKN
jgi:hypothetical protein